MSDEMIVRHCSPTLAGIKSGSLFACKYSDIQSEKNDFRRINRLLGPKGLRIIPLRFSPDRVLVYLYRPKMLKKDLSDEATANFLRTHGYTPDSSELCVAQLCSRFCSQSSFPHEVGLFLSYPAEDVLGFIVNKAKYAKCVGTWKVYGDEESAKRSFARYKKCTESYYVQWLNNKSIEQLAVFG